MFKDGQTVLVITDSKSLPILSHIKSQIGCKGNLEIIPTSELLQPSLRFKSEFFDLVMDPGLNYHSDNILFEFSRILKGGGVIFFQEPILSVKEGELGKLRTKEEFESSLLISGLEIEKDEHKTQSYENQDFIPLLAKQLDISPTALTQSLSSGKIKFIEFSTKKTDFEFGSSHSLSFSNTSTLNNKKTKIEESNNNNTITNNTNNNTTNNNVWKVKLEDMEDEDLDFVEEEGLLLKEDLIKSEKIVSFDPNSNNDDCGPGTSGKQRACKNCTCGRAEMEEGGNQVPQKKITLEDLENGIDLPESSCGSCFLGDAFRCPSCPMLGLPAFKPNEKVKLNLN